MVCCDVTPLPYSQGGAEVKRLGPRCVCLNLVGKSMVQCFSITISLLQPMRAPARPEVLFSVLMECKTILQSPPQAWTTVRWSTTRDGKSLVSSTLIVSFRPVRHHTSGEAATICLRFCVFTLPCCRHEAIDMKLHSTVHCRVTRFDRAHRHG